MMSIGEGKTYRHHFATLPNHAQLGAHVDSSAIQAAARLLDQSRDEKDARLPGDAL
jgi:hypothetical protein